MGGEKIRDSIKMLLLMLVLLISMTVVSASNTDNITLTDVEIEDIESFQDNTLTAQAEDEDLLSDSPTIVNQHNFYIYFDTSGKLKNEYGGKNITFEGEFTNKGKITISSDNTNITGRNTLFNNTVFDINGNNIVLSNLNFVLEDSFDNNNYAGIYVTGDNITVSNNIINYTTPKNVDGYGIYCEGSQYNRINNLKIIDNTINFIGNNPAEGRNYGVKLEYCLNATFGNNTVNAKLPLRTVAYVGTVAYLYSEFVLAVGISDCDNLLFSGNNINCEVNKRPECAYPTLDCVFICDSNNCNITNNKLTLRDSITYKDEPNYLYALDIYRGDNTFINNNSIIVETTGGAYAAGTAYPMQLTGPASGVLIQYNDIYSKSNGPNIGIYSHNFNGDNYITILNNHISITGRAGNHSWALVAGIESQDNNDIIMNNFIEVYTTEAVKEDDNLYGISYSQKTEGSHTYRVINNTVISNGYYLSHMLDAENTQVTNNTLVRTDKYSDTNYDPFKRGESIGKDTDASKNNDFSGNRVITIFEYGLEHQSNVVDGGEEFEYVPPTNTGNHSNIINGSGINPLNPGFPGGNPLIPGSNTGGVINTGGNIPGGFSGADVADGDNGYKGLPDLSGDDGKSLSRRNTQASNTKTVNSFNNDGTTSNSYNNLVASENSTSSETPSVNGAVVSGSASQSSAGASGSSGQAQESPKAYEITKDITETSSDDIIRFIGMAVICLMLLSIGYKRKETEEY